MCHIGSARRTTQLSAVIKALKYPDLDTLQQLWMAFGHGGALPLSLHRTAGGHYCAMIAETFVLEHICSFREFEDACLNQPY
jgi:hypothetical protein